MTPELPDDPDAEQVQAWVELAELADCPDFRATVRRMAEDQAAERGPGEATVPKRDLAARVRGEVAPALAAGIGPTSSRGAEIASTLTAHYAHFLGLPDGIELRGRLVSRLERMNDPRREQYFRLLAVINGWEAPESLAPVLDWAVQAVRAGVPR